ncbi:hypothetical protein H6F89_30505 [Cyanobacteria bacterium FACHB-63]|nr:hypothetical protein [Cyanobacteria bacterium FACHB-63]
MRHAILGAVAIGALAYAAPASALQTFNFTGSIQSWTVPTTGVYTITAFGARGGGSSGPLIIGGRGGQTGADFNLTEGQVISILVGRVGSNGSTGSGGGGGTFVTLGTGASAIPIVVAGGGGGGTIGGGGGGFGGSGSGGTIGTFVAGSGIGGGGSIGGGGGGFSTDGDSGFNGGGGFSFINGGIGGSNGGATANGGGGFGGGGTGFNSGGNGGGGGGGFNGGNGGSVAGSGGFGGNGFINQAFLADPSTVVIADGVRTTNGLVQITQITPVPFAFSPLPGLVVGGVLSRLRRRKQSQREANSSVKVG